MRQGKLLIDIIYSAASETESPRRNIAKAVRRVFYRICIFYVGCVSVSVVSLGTHRE